MKYLKLVICLTSGVATGCMKGDPSSQSTAEPSPGAPGLVVTTKESVRFEGPGMTIALAEGAHAHGAITATRPNTDGSKWDWNATFEIESSELRAANVRLEVHAISAESPVREAGTGTVTMVLSDDQIIAEGDKIMVSNSGTLSYTLHADGNVTGEATVSEMGVLNSDEQRSPNELSASFSGKFGISCWVYPETLGQSANGEGDGEVRIEDTAFSSSFCRPFQDLLHAAR